MTDVGGPRLPQEKVVLGCIKKQGEKAMESTVVSSTALQFLLQLLPSASYLELPCLLSVMEDDLKILG